jgi:UDP-N-acetylglucosamine 4,6-dehydratase/5-epimerase
MDWSQKTVLVTGGTGSFGRAFTRVLLDELHPAKIIVFSRDELKQHEMRVGGFDDPSLRYFIGDIRDRDRLRRAFAEVDIVVHAAAMKQVAACEYNPIEAIMTNVLGTRNVIDAALDTRVERALFIGTDKAVSPTNLYGATKLCGEKLFVESNAYSGARGTRFSCSRYGNVVGSRGSVIPLFKQQRETGTITVTDPRMTRFWITLEQGVRFVIHCIEEMHGGEVFVPKLPSMGLKDLADAIAPGCPIEEVGIRAGEKLHEVLVSEDEARHTLEFDDMFVIWPTHSWWHGDRWSSGRPLPDGYSFTSDDNERWLSVDELRALAGS